MHDEATDAILRARVDHDRAIEAFVRDRSGDLESLAARCADTLRRNGKLLLFGNGGSAMQAQHLAAEFVNRYDRDRPAIAALALTTDVSVITSVGNDDRFERVFARQIEALGNAGDLALAFSTTGSSPNLIAALRTARERGLRTAALVGRDGGPALREAELSIVVPGTDTARIQEVQLFACHVLCRRVEVLLGLRDTLLPDATEHGNSNFPGS